MATRNRTDLKRPAQIVREELGPAAGGDWDLGEHLTGCLAAYQSKPTVGNAVFFALEAVWGIGEDIRTRSDRGEISSEQLDPEWPIDPKSSVEVPWIWVSTLHEAWQRYKAGNGLLGHAFHLEGGKGKKPIAEILLTVLDQRAMARWIRHHVQTERATGARIRIEDAILDASEKFRKSDRTIRRAWKKYGTLEKRAAALRAKT
jgi:hypothetical protein